MHLNEIYNKFRENQGALDAYLEEEFEKTPPPFYLSCDIRNSGHKASVVDTNLYPAGFNNLCQAYTRQAIETFKARLKRTHPEAKKILVFSEAHTRNKFYFENLKRLSEILEGAGAEVRVATSFPDFPEDPFVVFLDGEKTLALYQLKKEGERAALK